MQQAERLDLGQAVYKKAERRRLTSGRHTHTHTHTKTHTSLSACVCVYVCVLIFKSCSAPLADHLSPEKQQ